MALTMTLAVIGGVTMTLVGHQNDCDCAALEGNVSGNDSWEGSVQGSDVRGIFLVTFGEVSGGATFDQRVICAPGVESCVGGSSDHSGYNVSAVCLIRNRLSFDPEASDEGHLARGLPFS